MTVKPTYEELERRVQELEKIESKYKSSKEAFRESENLFKMLYEKAPLGYQSLDENGHFIVVNQTWLDTLGYTKEEVIGESFASFLHPDWRDHFKENFPRFKSIGEVLGVEFEMVKKNGDLILVSFTGKISRDKKGDFQQTHCIFHDITERKKHEELLERYKNIVSSTTDAIAYLDENYRYIIANDAYEDFSGVKRDDFIGMTVAEYMGKDIFEEKIKSNIDRCLNGETVNYQEWFEYPTKGKRFVDVTYFPYRDGGNHISGVIAISRDITERKQDEGALKLNYAMLQIAGETAKFGGWSVDLEKNICTWSDAVADIHDAPHGYSPPVQEAINFYAPEWREKITHIFSACAKDGIPYDEEMEIITQKGKLVWVRATGKAVKNEKDIIIKVQGSFQDITAKKQAEEKLSHSQKLMQYIIEHTNSAVAVHDRNMHFIYVSQRYLDDYKVNENNIIGKHHYDVFPDLPQKWRDVHQKALAGEISKADRDPYFRDDGTIEWTRWECRPWYEEDGSIGGIIVYTEVITDWINAEEKLRSSHERILTILDSIDSTVYVADVDTYEILFMNKRMITDFGGDKTGDICYHALRKKSEPCERCTNDQLIDKQGKPAGVRIWDDRNPITGRYYINYDRAIEWTDGRLVRMQIATDITDLKKMEAQLNQAQKMESVGRLAGGVAHDFNNMLGVILGHTELALLKADEDNDLISDLKEIQTAAKRSADITKQLLAFARKEIISPRKLDLSDTVESMLNMLRRLIGEDIDLVWKPAAHLWPVKMDPSQIDQILANLCVNARDAISGMGKLTIETGRKTFDEEYCKEHAGFIPGDFVLLAVSDNGSGMNKETLENLFEPFFTTKDIGKGTGLGLPTIYGIVKQNNGFINVYSEPGQGSTFKIYLPRLVVDEDTDKAVREKKAAAGGTETILLVEDEPTILRMTQMMLERKGYSVLPAATPGEAIEMARNHTDKIHLLMTDVVMPEMNGRDLAEQLIPLYPEIKLLFMSGYTANVIAHHGVLDDGVAFIQKPFSMADMTEKVRKVLDMASDKS